MTEQNDQKSTGASNDAPVFFDPDTLHQTLTNIADSTSDPEQMRADATQALREAYKAARQSLDTHIDTYPQQAEATKSHFAALADMVVCAALNFTITHLYPQSGLTEPEALALFAVGGYGRAEMAPGSDIDLLFLTASKRSAWIENTVETTLYMLWDLGLKVGHATRSIADCLRLSEEDVTIRTSLLEKRLLAGDATLAQRLETSLRDKLFCNSGPEFIEAKLAERAARHERFGRSRYLVEPNIKEGKGGLRDLQTLYWIAKYLYDVATPSELIKKGVFTRDEYEIFDEAERFLWRLRVLMHHLARRPQEKLSFEAQIEIAERLGYQDGEGRRAVENFMQDYYRHAKNVGELTRIFLTSLEATYIKIHPSISQRIKGVFSYWSTNLGADYTLTHGRINLVDEQKFLADPRNLLWLFHEALRTGRLIHPDAMRLVARNLHLIDETLRNDPEANQIFLETLLDFGDPERALRRMTELGVLGTFMPEFADIICLMQFNMYHHYTVDEHTFECFRVLSEIEAGGHIEDLPVASEIIKGKINRQVLYVALLLHDIGKGRPEDHSILGARIAAKVAPRLGLNAEETEAVVWLVENHLLMSDVAQKRDLSDPRTVSAFAEEVKSKERLDLLLVLTVCDISGVGPGVWNNWKAILLRELHEQTKRQLESGEQASTKDLAEDARNQVRAALADWEEAEREQALNRYDTPYWVGLDPESQIIIARLGRDIRPGDIHSDLQPAPERDATRACFSMIDHPGIFSRLAGALALSGANVVEARTYTGSDGIAAFVFWIQDAEGQPYEESRLAKLKRTIDKTLSGEIIARDQIKSRDKIKSRERAFTRPTRIRFDNEGSDIYTIIEVDTRDRLGLLYDITRTLSALNLTIAAAVIATYGEQAIDTFYVKDLFGLKIHAKNKQQRINDRLQDVLESNASQAMTN